MRVSNEDYRRVAEAIRAAEQKTGAEIVCVLARRSSDYSYVPALWASFAALATPWPLIAFTHLPVREIFAAQIAVFIAAALLFSLSPVHSLLTPRRIKRARAHRAAREQFFTRGVGRTSDRRGVLIFASLAERYARIIADVGVARNNQGRGMARRARSFAGAVARGEHRRRLCRGDRGNRPPARRPFPAGRQG